MAKHAGGKAVLDYRFTVHIHLLTFKMVHFGMHFSMKNIVHDMFAVNADIT